MGTRNQEKLGEWFREWHLPLRRFLRRKSSATIADIDDIAQETFLRLMRYDRSDLVEHPQAYLFKVASNVCAEWAARASNKLSHSSSLLDELQDAASISDELERKQSDKLVTNALKSLAPRPREVLRLHHAENLTYEEIATRLRVTRRVVKRDIVEAYAKLRASLPVDALLSVTSLDARSTGKSS